MAYIRKLKSGRWQASIRKVNEPNQSKTFTTKGDAERWATEIEARMNRKEFFDISEASKWTLAAAFEKYLNEVTPKKKGKKVEESRILAFIQLPIAEKSLANFTANDVSDYKNSRLKLGKSESTVVKDLSLISHLFTTAKKEWHIHCINPVNDVSKPKVNNSRDRRLSALEEKYLLKAITDNSSGKRKNNEVLSITLLALETAMRRSEILGLKWTSINLDSSVLHLEDTKNGEMRNVPLSTQALKLLNDLKMNRADKTSKNIFKTTESAFEQSFARAVQRGRKYYLKDFPEDAKNDEFLVNFKFHDIRHEATSRLADIFEMHELMKITGHKDSRMLARYYHPKAEVLAKKLKKSELSKVQAEDLAKEISNNSKVEISASDYQEFLNFKKISEMMKENLLSKVVI